MTIPDLLPRYYTEMFRRADGALDVDDEEGPKGVHARRKGGMIWGRRAGYHF